MDTLPWYKQFWPWLLIAIPFSAVIMGVVTFILANNNGDSLVRSDFYQEGKVINRKLQLEQQALRQNITGSLAIHQLNGEISAHLTGKMVKPTVILLELIHPTKSIMDHQLPLKLTANGEYIGQTTTIPAGRWYLQLSDYNKTWRIKGTISFNNSKPENNIYSTKLDAALEVL